MSTTKRASAKAAKKKKPTRPGAVVVAERWELRRCVSGSLWLSRADVDDPEGMAVDEAKLARVLAAFYRREF